MKQVFSLFFCLILLAGSARAQQTPHSVWAGVGAGGSWYGGVPVAIGYEYHLNPRWSLLGTFQRTAWAEESPYLAYYEQVIRHRIFSISIGARLYVPTEQLLNGRISPFFELHLIKHTYNNDLLGYANYNLSPSPVALSAGCVFAPTDRSGLFAKMNLGTLSLIDLGYTYHF